MNIKDYLPLVTKPSRYIDGEVNSAGKDPAKVKLLFGLGFPDVYEVGMSHLGIQILYQILNSRDDIACERVFAPWMDMETLLREKGTPLKTLENDIPLRELDIMGFSLQYELSYTNVLNMCDLGGIPLLSKDRGEEDPIVIGGGPAAFNPEPVADFFDCFLLGDGEEAVLEIVDAVIEAKEKSLKRDEVLKRLSGIEGVYVPSFFAVDYNNDGTVKEIRALEKTISSIKKRIVADLNALPLNTRPVVPFTRAVHDRLSVEIARGCTRGCRFCHAGYVYRPLRERDPELVTKAVTDGLKNTGYDEISLLSLSTGDYTCIEGLLSGLMKRLADERVAVSLPSLRVGTLSPSLTEEIKRVRKTGFTLAPEAGSSRLRRLINKNIEEEELLKTVKNIFSLGWRAVKLYFMVGLPTETEEDLLEIVRLATAVRREAKRAGGGRPRVSVSVATFIPKPFTPFQWEPQIPPDEARKRLAFLKKRLKPLGLDIKWHDARMSFLEGVFSRGDRRLAPVILRAFRKGCRFDGWTEELRFDLWEESFREEGLDMAFYTLKRRDTKELLPWEHLDCEISKDFLIEEYEKSLRLEETPDCRIGACSLCGVCDFTTVKNVTFRDAGASVGVSNVKAGRYRPMKIRLRFSKTGDLRFLSHLELVSAVHRTLRRAGIRPAYSKGFHPLPKTAFSSPLAVGIESLDEYMDMETEGPVRSETLVELLNGHAPVGLKFLSASVVPLKVPPPSAMIKSTEYIAFLKSGPLGLNIDLKRFDGFLRDILGRESILLHLERKKKAVDLDIRPLIGDISLSGDLTLRFNIKSADGTGVRPHEVLAFVLNLSPEDASLIPILKTKALC